MQAFDDRAAGAMAAVLLAIALAALTVTMVLARLAGQRRA
jgi:hypothetical protein